MTIVAPRKKGEGNALVERRTRFVGGSDLDLHKEGAVRTALFRAVDCWSRQTGQGRATCAREGSAFHPVVPFRNSWKLVQQEEGMEED